jgi:hypothetical protein
LEAVAEVEDRVGFGEFLDVAARELEVVRLDTGRSEVPNGRSRCRDLLGGVRERIEGSDDRRIGVPVVIGVPLVIPAATGRERNDDDNESDSLFDTATIAD